jgi:hypothetical protein
MYREISLLTPFQKSDTYQTMFLSRFQMIENIVLPVIVCAVAVLMVRYIVALQPKSWEVLPEVVSTLSKTKWVLDKDLDVSMSSEEPKGSKHWGFKSEGEEYSSYYLYYSSLKTQNGLSEYCYTKTPSVRLEANLLNGQMRWARFNGISLNPNFGNGPHPQTRAAIGSILQIAKENSKKV